MHAVRSAARVARTRRPSATLLQLLCWLHCSRGSLLSRPCWLTRGTCSEATRAYTRRSCGRRDGS
eukprot:3281899-Prymnesium_polylepis.1